MISKSSLQIIGLANVESVVSTTKKYISIIQLLHFNLIKKACYLQTFYLFLLWSQGESNPRPLDPVESRFFQNLRFYVDTRIFSKNSVLPEIISPSFFMYEHIRLCDFKFLIFRSCFIAKVRNSWTLYQTISQGRYGLVDLTFPAL